MDKVEVLVHIAAASGLKDDRRYREQAEAVAHFQAANIIKVSSEPESPQIYRTPQTRDFSGSFDTSLDGWSEIVKETPAQMHACRLLAKDGQQISSTAPESPTPAMWTLTKPMPAVKTQSINGKSQRTALVNAPYKNTVLPQSRLDQPAIQLERTPEQIRPKTAPAGTSFSNSGTLTGWVTRKRAHSESSSFGSLSSVVPETQYLEKGNTALYSSSSGSTTHHFPSSDPANMPAEEFDNRDESLSNNRRPAKRQRISDRAMKEPDVVQQTLPWDHNCKTACFFPQDRSLDFTSSAPSIKGSSISSSPRAFFLQDRSLDFISSAPALEGSGSSPTGTTSTATPSQTYPSTPQPPPASNTPNHPVARTYHTYPDPSSPINIISQDLETSPPQIPTLPPYSFSQHPPPPTLPYPSITSLSPSILPEPPPTSSHPPKSHLTSFLLSLITRLPLARTFRPVHVTRDVSRFERGAWRLAITIASPAAVNAARSEHPRPQGVLKRKQNLWTEAEFLAFWRVLEEKIGCDVAAGWGVRVYREDAPLPQSSTELTSPPAPTPAPPTATAALAPQRDIILRVSTWGEVLAHVWVLLWVLSEKRTAYVPMEWRDGEDGVVVLMSGQRQRHGRLGEWVDKGRKRGWGISDSVGMEVEEV